MTTRLTAEDEFNRLVYVAEWSPQDVQSLLETCTERGLENPEDILRYAQSVLDAQCLSVLRGGDPALDAQVAEAFRVRQPRMSRSFS